MGVDEEVLKIQKKIVKITREGLVRHRNYLTAILFVCRFSLKFYYYCYRVKIKHWIYCEPCKSLI